MSNGDQEYHVELSSDSGWGPEIGSEALTLLGTTKLDDEARARVAEEAAAILGSGVPVNAESGRATGLVVGYVQSGKTLSFTTVAALARDNRYAVVIVVTGTSTSLTGQSRTRIERDLRLDSRADMMTWMPFHNPKVQSDLPGIVAALEEWDDEAIPDDEKSTVLITVMKNHRHLANLVEVLQGLPLERRPVLIIDDEADQASLNTLINQSDESTTYRRLNEIRQQVPHHTFLQYTATPQAPLLINIIDVLSPDFAHVLTEGAGYTGGRTFFGGDQRLIVDIPLSDIPTNNNVVTEPPESLLEALRIFYLGVASGLARGELRRGHRSMLVHPSQRTDPQRQCFSWVSTAQREWGAILGEGSGPDFDDLVAEFREQYEDLRGTVADLEAFETLLRPLQRAVKRTLVHEVNATQGSTPEIPWTRSRSHILVGGQALDRGYTVEGLTVTYMPRPLGGGNADTLQQRARFFGYKEKYLGYCRVYLHPDVRRAFTGYVEHEELLRLRLSEFAAAKRPLNQMRRVFLLDRTLRPTRGSVLDIDFVRIRGREGWVTTRAPQKGARANVDEVRRFLDTVKLEADPYLGEGEDRRRPAQRHRYCAALSLRKVFEELLVGLEFADIGDAQNWLGLLFICRAILDEDDHAECCLYVMSPDEVRTRSLTEESYVPNLLQGAYPVNPDVRGSIYPGDRELFDPHRLTLQLHVLDLVERGSGRVIETGVVAVASRVPQELQRDLLIQNQGQLMEAE